MRKTLLAVALVMSFGAQAYAADGDLIVNGKLGVGTGAATLDEKVTVKGTSQNTGIKLISGYPDYGNGRILAATSGNGLQLLQNIDMAGNLDDTTKTGQQLVIGYGYGGFRFNTFSAGTNPRTATNLMTIRDTGNVGIGTTNPEARLDVNSLATNVAGLLVRGGSSIGTPSAASGQILLGNTAADRGVFSYDDNTGELYIDNTFNSSAGKIYFRTKTDGATTNALTISGNGNVGIGTTTPSSSFKLDVQGTIGSNNASVLTSDAKFKKNLLPINDSLGKVLKLEGLSYEWKTEEYKDKGFAEGRHYGVIAQDIEKVLPEVVNTAPDGTKAVAYTEIIPVLIEAIKEQQKQIDELKKKLAELQ